MNNSLEFDKIKNMLSELALSQNAKIKIDNLKPCLEETQCKRMMDETSQAKNIMHWCGTPPLSSMEGLSEFVDLAHAGAMLSPEQLVGVTLFLSACRRMKGYLQKAEINNIAISSYGSVFYTLDDLFDQISLCIRNNHVEDNASPALRDIRRKIDITKNAVKTKLETILRSHKDWFEEGYIATRNDRDVLPVKKKFKNQINGSVVDISGTGSTYFIEPAAVGKLQTELATLEIEEDNEVRKILYTLTAMVEAYSGELKINIECMQTLDFLFAKAKLSIQMHSNPVTLTTDRVLKIVNARHPLIPMERAIPLNFSIGGDNIGVVITGPNTGGKTVTLKTIGLLSIMAQCGLHVPAEEGSVFCMHNQILCDIGDGQSISENLSTFSSHIVNIISILNTTTNESLVLLDELGSGTDPAEGMGIAIAILDELRRRKCLFVATTHYPEIKQFANDTHGLINARMAFDRESLQPLYRLEIGEAGQSCALYIAKRLGFPDNLLKRAHNEAYKTEIKPIADASTTNYISQIKKEQPKKAIPNKAINFNIGDSVMVYPQNTIGIVYKPADDKGQIIVQIKGEKLSVNHKRIKLITSASELYTEDYDFSIIFDTVDNRKARKSMQKHHNPNIIIEQP